MLTKKSHQLSLSAFNLFLFFNPHLTSLYFSSSHLISPHLTSPYLTSPHFTLPHFTSTHLTSPHLNSLHLTSPYLTSPHLTSPHLSFQVFTALSGMKRLTRNLITSSILAEFGGRRGQDQANPRYAHHS